jgi:hypothetical protein
VEKPAERAAVLGVDGRLDGPEEALFLAFGGGCLRAEHQLIESDLEGAPERDELLQARPDGAPLDAGETARVDARPPAQLPLLPAARPAQLRNPAAEEEEILFRIIGEFL